MSRKDELLTAAMTLFGKLGYDGTTLDAVAESAGVRKQSLLYYFPSKEELFQACVDRLGEILSSALERALEGPELGWDRVENVIRSIFRMAAEHPQAAPFAREAARRSPQVVGKVAGALEPLRKRALLFLERGMDEGIFQRQDPGLLLFTLYTAIVGSLTEAGVLRAVAGGATGRMALQKRQEELIQFVRRAL